MGSYMSKEDFKDLGYNVSDIDLKIRNYIFFAFSSAVIFHIFDNYIFQKIENLLI